MSTKEPDGGALEKELRDAFEGNGASPVERASRAASSGSAMASGSIGASGGGARDGYVGGGGVAGGGIRGRMVPVPGMKRIDGSDYPHPTVLGNVVGTFDRLAKVMTSLRDLEERVHGAPPMEDFSEATSGPIAGGALHSLDARRRVADGMLNEAEEIIARLSLALAL